MANVKISALTSASTPLAGTEVLPIVQSSATVKVAVSDLTAGRDVTAASLTTTGNVGVGGSLSAWRAGGGNLEINAATNGYIAINGGGGGILQNAYRSSSSFVYKNTGTASYFNIAGDGSFTWNTAASGTAGNTISFTQAMILEASGNLLVGATSVVSASVSGLTLRNNASGNLLSGVTSTASRDHMVFFNPNGAVGTISTSGSATSYVTSSDYRLKNTIAPMTDALAKVALLKPVTYKWNSNGSDGQGFIAHELQSVVPECVTGEKDGVDKNGKPVYQGIDTSFLVATLTAAIQEQQAVIESLKARLDAANL